MEPQIILAKLAVENYIKKGEIISPSEDLPKDILKKRAGVFVTIQKEKELRGCIGTYLPTKNNIAEEIISNAIAAATRDYRFFPVQKKELPYLNYTVYLLNEPELVSGPEELDPKRYGVLVKNNPEGDDMPKGGLLLPDLEGVDTAEKQLMIACKKAGIDIKKEKISIYRFTVDKFE